MKTPTTITTKRSPCDIVYILHKNKIRQATIQSVNVTIKHRPDLFTQQRTTLQMIETYSSTVKNITPHGIVNSEYAFTTESETFDSTEQLIAALTQERDEYNKID